MTITTALMRTRGSTAQATRSAATAMQQHVASTIRFQRAGRRGPAVAPPPAESEGLPQRSDVAVSLPARRPRPAAHYQWRGHAGGGHCRVRLAVPGARPGRRELDPWLARWAPILSNRMDSGCVTRNDPISASRTASRFRFTGVGGMDRAGPRTARCRPLARAPG